jgi:hypothetical protein
VVVELRLPLRTTRESVSTVILVRFDTEFPLLLSKWLVVFAINRTAGCPTTVQSVLAKLVINSDNFSQLRIQQKRRYFGSRLNNWILASMRDNRATLALQV